MSVLWQLIEIFLLSSCAHSMAKNSVGFTEGLSYSRVTYLASFVNYLLHGSVYLYQPQHLSASAWAIFIPHWRGLQYSCRTAVIFPLLLVLVEAKISFCEIKLAWETIFENWHLGKCSDSTNFAYIHWRTRSLLGTQKKMTLHRACWILTIKLYSVCLCFTVPGKTLVTEVIWDSYHHENLRHISMVLHT